MTWKVKIWFLYLLKAIVKNKDSKIILLEMHTQTYFMIQPKAFKDQKIYVHNNQHAFTIYKKYCMNTTPP
jgi:hypothetical protein